jgi:hypothetical protein
MESNPLTESDDLYFFELLAYRLQDRSLGVTTNSHQQVGMLQNYPHKGADPQPLPLHNGTAGKNHLNEEITPLPPHWDRREILPNCRIPIRHFFS